MSSFNPFQKWNNSRGPRKKPFRYSVSPPVPFCLFSFLFFLTHTFHRDGHQWPVLMTGSPVPPFCVFPFVPLFNLYLSNLASPDLSTQPRQAFFCKGGMGPAPSLSFPNKRPTFFQDAPTAGCALVGDSCRCSFLLKRPWPPVEIP